MAIAPSKPKTPNAPSPTPKPSNKPTQPPKNAVQWQKGMSTMYQGQDWVIGTLGTATAKIIRNGFELWVDIPDLAIATDTKYVVREIKVREVFYCLVLL